MPKFRKITAEEAEAPPITQIVIDEPGERDTDYIRVSLYLPRKAFENLNELATELNALARSGVNYGKPGWRPLIHRLAMQDAPHIVEHLRRIRAERPGGKVYRPLVAGMMRTPNGRLEGATRIGPREWHIYDRAEHEPINHHPFEYYAPTAPSQQKEESDVGRLTGRVGRAIVFDDYGDPHEFDTSTSKPEVGYSLGPIYGRHAEATIISDTTPYEPSQQKEESDDSQSDITPQCERPLCQGSDSQSGSSLDGSPVPEQSRVSNDSTPDVHQAER